MKNKEPQIVILCSILTWQLLHFDNICPADRKFENPEEDKKDILLSPSVVILQVGQINMKSIFERLHKLFGLGIILTFAQH